MLNFKTVTLTDLKKDSNALFAGVTREQPLQVLHRAHPVKVVIPLDHYLDLVTCWHSGERGKEVVPKALEQELREVREQYRALMLKLEGSSDHDAGDSAAKPESETA